MDLKEALLKEHSKKQALLIASYIGDNPGRFDDLMKLFFSKEYRVAQRAAWVMSHCTDHYPGLMRPHLKRLVKNLQDPTLHVAIKRNTVRFLSNYELPKDLMGLVADYCFKFLADPKEAVAVRVHAMLVLYNFCKKEPGLSNELKILIEENMLHGTAAFKARGRKILQGLKKIAVS